MSHRLSAQDVADRRVTEEALQRGILELASWLGWHAVHWRPLQNRRGRWQVPFEGSLGRGWPDLTLVQPVWRRLVFAEVKRQLGIVSPEQIRVLELLGELAGDEPAIGGPPLIAVAIWRPSDFRDPIEASEVYRVLSARPHA